MQREYRFIKWLNYLPVIIGLIVAVSVISLIGINNMQKPINLFIVSVFLIAILVVNYIVLTQNPVLIKVNGTEVTFKMLCRTAVVPITEITSSFLTGAGLRVNYRGGSVIFCWLPTAHPLKDFLRDVHEANDKFVEYNTITDYLQNKYKHK